MNTVKPVNHTILTLKKEAVENSRRSLLLAGGWMACCFLIGGWAGYFGAGGGETFSFFYFFFSTMMSCFVASLAFSDLKTREGRIALLMSPASAFDKFLARALGILIGTLILTILGYIACELARLLADGIFNKDWTSFYVPTSLPIRVGGKEGLVINLTVFGSWYFGVAFYFLGSILWPKYSFLKTLLAAWVLQMFAGVFIAMAVNLNFSFVGVAEWLTHHENLFLTLIACSTYVAGTFLFFLAWLRLKHSTILISLFR